MPSKKFQKEGGLMHGFQIWVNLPAKDKMCKPRYQEYQADGIPKVTSPDGKTNVVVITGEAYGTSAIIETHTPIAMLHYRVAPGGTGVWEVPTATGWRNGREGDDLNVMCYVVGGKGKFGGSEKAAEENDMVVFQNGPSAEDKGASVTFRNDGNEELSVLLLAGKPLKEPMSRYGPFVMNTKEEIEQAFWDYQTGQFGKIDF
ncbi:RmlC-like cupin domain-containing protein [Jimgerdemannia flammicorona]|uniref:RmlC-like cupin domain-containing protein n=1 Tax=Jimgerdemannia flammicorona TaxID=994334 RepID=A0A433BAD8_9FUNG|nr:RmlC-like cupin domain-containing protein [Jimgerdemannia flammicorona]